MSKSIFKALSEIEKRLDKNFANWICGEELNNADIYLFPKVIR